MKKMSMLLICIMLTGVLAGCTGQQNQKVEEVTQSTSTEETVVAEGYTEEAVSTTDTEADSEEEKELFAKADDVLEEDDAEATKAIAAGDLTKEQYNEFCDAYNQMVDYYNDCVDYYCENDSIPANADVEDYLLKTSKVIETIGASAKNGIKKADLPAYYDSMNDVCTKLKELIDAIS